MTALLLFIALLLIGANAFFVAAEFALAKVRPTALEALAKKGDANAQRAFKITHQLDAYLSATQLGITLASLALGWVGEPAVAHLIQGGLVWIGVAVSGSEPGPWVHAFAVSVAFTVLSVLHIVLGELVPKSTALQRPEDVSRLSSRPLQIFYWVSFPALWMLNGLSNLVLRALRLPAPDHAEGKLSHEELTLIIKASFSERGIEGTKRDLLERVLRATDRPLRAVMVPRVDMRFVSLGDDFATCMAQVRKYGYSRYPVAEDGDPDKIVGYVYVKDLLMVARHRERPIGALKRDILYVPESRTVGELLNQFQATKIPIAIVVDEYGGTSGLVTLEDVVEELVGDLQDEFHLEEPKVRQLEDGTVVVDAALPIGEIKLDGFDPEPIEGAETVQGYLVAALGRLAHPGDRVRIGEYLAVVEDVRRRRVHRVAFRKLDPEELERPEVPSLPPDAP